MTDPTNPTDPSDPTTEPGSIDPAAEARLRATLLAAAPADTHVEDGLADLRARLDGATVVPLARVDAARPPRSRLVLAAAAVVAVAALGAGIAVATRDDGGTRTTTRTTEPDGTTSVPSSPTTTVPGAPVGDLPAWYVPVDLPDGWSLESVTTDHHEVNGVGQFGDGSVCPCERTTWGEPLGGAILTVATADHDGPLGDPPQEAADLEPVALGGGVQGEQGTLSLGFDAGYDRIVRWVADGRLTTLSTGGLAEDLALAAARSVVAGAEGSPVEGLEELRTAAIPAGFQASTSIDVGLRTPQGRTVGFQLFPTGYGDDLFGYALPQRYRAEGQQEPLWRYDLPPTGDLPAVTSFSGTWPGADVTVGAANLSAAAAETDVDLDDLIRLAASLRPATAAEWSAFLDTASDQVGDDVPRTGAVADLTISD